MIHARVNARLEARLPLLARGPGAEEHELDAVVDTGFNGFLTIPPSLADTLDCPLLGRTRAMLANGQVIVLDLFEVHLLWDGRWQVVEAEAADGEPLVGMALLSGNSVYIEAVDGGRVAIEPLT